MAEFFTKRTTASFAYTFDWSDQMPADTTILSVSMTVPTKITLADESADLAGFQYTAWLSGGTHGHAYEVIGTAALSNGESVPLSMTLAVFDG